MEENIYIEAIKYGKEKLKKREMTTKKDLKEYLESQGYEIPNSNFLIALFLDIFGSDFMKKNSLSSDPTFLNAESYFNLLDHEELKHARQSSQEAKKLAIVAIIISGILALASIGLTIYQINRSAEIKIDNAQFQELLNKQENSEKYERRD